MKIIEVKRGNVVVKIYPRHRVRGGKASSEYIIADLSSGTRKLRSFANLDAAKKKAGEIADAIKHGQVDVIKWGSGLRLELRKALEAVEPTGVSILPAIQLFAAAVKMLGGPDDLLPACQHWKLHRPDKPLTPKTVEQGVSDFKAARKGRISAHRWRTEESYLKSLTLRCGPQLLHELAISDIEGIIAEKTWAPKTKNDFLSTVSGLFRHGQDRCWVPKDFNPTQAITRHREVGGPIAVFEPWEARQILTRLAVSSPGLVPTVALWLFSGIRKEEIGRLTWPQVNVGLVTGFIELQATQTKTGQPRVVPVADNLKAWLEPYRKDSGHVTPAPWLTPTKTAQNRLSELTRFIARKTGVVWKDNAPRHSYASYHFKLHKDAGATTAAMGTSLEKFQRHYWNKAHTLTEETAREWFSIAPLAPGNIVPLPVPSTAVPSITPTDSSSAASNGVAVAGGVWPLRLETPRAYLKVDRPRCSGQQEGRTNGDDGPDARGRVGFRSSE